MRKLKFILISVVVALGIWLYVMNNRLPDLPFNSMSGKQVETKIKNSSKELVELSEEDGVTWYISEAPKDKAKSNLINRLIQDGWIFKEKEGNEYLFHRDGEEIIIESQMWTKDYILFQVPITI